MNEDKWKVLTKMWNIFKHTTKRVRKKWSGIIQRAAAFNFLSVEYSWISFMNYLFMKLREKQMLRGSTLPDITQNTLNDEMKRKIWLRSWFIIKTEDGRKQCHHVFKVLYHDFNISKKPVFQNWKPKQMTNMKWENVLLKGPSFQKFWCSSGWNK